MKLYLFDTVIESKDLNDLEIKHFSHMPQKYNLMVGEISLWFENYEDLKTFCLAVQSDFENLMVKETVAK